MIDDQHNEASALCPMMQQRDIARIQNILQTHPAQHLTVLEWGSGGSTVFFPIFLQQLGRPYTWTSIEYNRDWYERIAKRVDQHTALVLIDAGSTEVKQRDNPMNEYVSYPSTTGKRYDVILVDGRKRRRCLLEARELLKPGGVVLLHDAQRRYYHCAFNAFPNSRMLTKCLWRGSLEIPSWHVRLVNCVRYWSFYLLTTIRSRVS